MDRVFSKVVHECQAHRGCGKHRLKVLELGAGTTKHAEYLIQRHASSIHSWLLTDLPVAMPELMSSWRHSHLKRYFPTPLTLGFQDTPERWSAVARGSEHIHSSLMSRGRLDLIFTSNTFHVAPWPACCEIFAKAYDCLAERGHLVIYGPFTVPQYRLGKLPRELVKAQELFQKGLRGRFGAEAGLRSIDSVLREASKNGFDVVCECALEGGNTVLAMIKRDERNVV